MNAQALVDQLAELRRDIPDGDIEIVETAENEALVMVYEERSDLVYLVRLTDDDYPSATSSVPCAPC